MSDTLKQGKRIFGGHNANTHTNKYTDTNCARNEADKEDTNGTMWMRNKIPAHLTRSIVHFLLLRFVAGRQFGI